MRYARSGWLVVMLAVILASCSKKASSPTSPSPTPTTCTYTISTTSFSMAGAGGTATFAVNTGTSCAWTVSSNSSFVTITSASSQTGSGTVSFSVPENTGDTRTATLTVAGQAVTVTQAPNDQVYGNWGGTITKGTGCSAALPASVDWTGTIRRTSTGSNEFAIIIPALAVSQTLPIVINGSTVQFTVALDAVYAFTATLSSDRRALSGSFSGGACSGTWSGTRR